jgi:hypothetical protein
MDRYNELKLEVLSLFAATGGKWLRPQEAAEELHFFPARSALGRIPGEDGVVWNNIWGALSSSFPPLNG